MSQIVALIGYPLKHSVSPAFQQVAFAYHRLDIHYEAWEREPFQLERALSLLRQPTVLGANITIPYKEAVLPLLDEVREGAIQVGAVNTIVHRRGKLSGYNTDAGGFLRALRENGNFEPRGGRAVILGAGGAARGVGFALMQAGIKSITIINRTLHRAEALATCLQDAMSVTKQNPEIKALPWEENIFSEALASCHLVVNCTPIGMKHSSTEGDSPLTARFIPSDALVYDLVYNPVDTPLLQGAREAGARTLGGLAMLVYQGALSFELWTGKKAPIDIMMKVAREELP